MVLFQLMLFQASGFFTSDRVTAQGYDNLDVLGAVVYQSFMEQAEALSPVQDNTAYVSMNDVPVPLEAGIPWRDDAEAAPDTDDVLTGVPDARNYRYNSSMVYEKMTVFLDNMVRYVQMQGEDERLPINKKKFDILQSVAAKAKRVEPELYNILNDEIKQKERKLKLND